MFTASREQIAKLRELVDLKRQLEMVTNRIAKEQAEFDKLSNDNNILVDNGLATQALQYLKWLSESQNKAFELSDRHSDLRDELENDLVP